MMKFYCLVKRIDIFTEMTTESFLDMREAENLDSLRVLLSETYGTMTGIHKKVVDGKEIQVGWKFLSTNGHNTTRIEVEALVNMPHEVRMYVFEHANFAGEFEHAQVYQPIIEHITHMVDFKPGV